MKKNISVIVLTLNEELHLKRCLESVGGVVDQIIVIDSGSNDRTLDIARSFSADVYNHEFKNQAEQFNWALENADIKGDWILKLDADEYLTKELSEEISKLQPVEGVNGYYMKRKVFFMGRWIRHGGYYPRWFMRLFRKGKGRSEEREMDEHLVITEGKSGKLKNDFIDENLRDLNWWTEKHNSFSSREVIAEDKNDIGEQKTHEDKKRIMRKSLYMKLPLFCRSFWYFIWRYFFRLGFLDGRQGLIFHFLQGFWYRFLVDAKIYELKRKKLTKI